ncbi:hypothetical protein [Burkholderia multivorans]|uniref:hypothetical protein n=1 Tax=Burkholderia multivorans TaxID=87883 RepID=UPI001C27CC33|nr:hypothetical protein [Burkholderia multivorans]MBU9336813.1 hypothetical protein [Burkholderia multivorans]MCA8480154.1 hypothetical protein [Burkholderia multivorans]
MGGPPGKLITSGRISVRNEQIESKVMVMEMHPNDYHHVERAAQKLGYSGPEFMRLSAHLVASAVVNGDDVLQTPLALRGSADFGSQ